MNLKNTILGLKIYNGFLSFMYLCLTICFAFLIIIILTGEADLYSSTSERIVNIFFLSFSLILIIVSILLHFIGFLFTAKKGKANWIFQIVLVCFGFSSLITMIPSVFLLIGLLSEESKQFYLNRE